MPKWPINQGPVDLAKQTVTPGFFKALFIRIQAYQNVVFFIVLVVSLLLLLFVWRQYRMKQLSRQVWRQLVAVNTVDDLQMMLQQFKQTKTVPFINFQLANAYQRENKFDEAKKLYEEIINSCPQRSLHQESNALHRSGKLQESETKDKELSKLCPFYASLHLLVDYRLRVLSTIQAWETGELKKHFSDLRTQRNHPHVTLKTNRGDFKIELFEDEAPNTTAHFINLVEEKFYNQMPLAAVQDDLGICLGNKGITPTDTIAFESNELRHQIGSLGMMRDLDPQLKDGQEEGEKFRNSASFLFYITLKSQPQQDGRYTIFGRVIAGMDLVNQLKEGDLITEVVIDKKRDHSYQPKTIPR